MNIKTILILMGEPNSTFQKFYLNFSSKKFKKIKKNSHNWM